MKESFLKGMGCVLGVWTGFVIADKIGDIIGVGDKNEKHDEPRNKDDFWDEDDLSGDTIQ